MRDIKFRVWDKATNSMVTDSGKVYLNGCVSICDTWATRDCVLMQFTGLFDAKSVDIYEGDIVSDHVGIGIVKYSEKHGAFRVSYGNNQAKWFYDYILNGERESIEVIGNIYETPELMEQ